MFVGSCSEHESETEKMDAKSEEYLQYMETHVDDLLSVKPVLTHKTRGTTITVNFNVGTTTMVYIDFPKDTTTEEKKLSRIATLGDLLKLTETAGVVVSLERNELTTDSLCFSNNEAKEKLAPSVQKSKEYLYSYGFTDDSIQQMLDENNADETALVPFVLACIEHEKNSLTAYSYKPLDMNSLFASNANAFTIDWDKASNCAVSALGLDVFWAIGQSSLKTWGIAAMKKAFKTVATKVVGPMGALIAAGQFTYCYMS